MSARQWTQHKRYEIRFLKSARGRKIHMWEIFAKNDLAATDYANAALRVEYYGQAVLLDVWQRTV